MSGMDGKRIFFIGIGGIGMSGLARYYKRHGAEVAGYDRTPSELTNQLQSEGITVQFAENTSLIPDAFTLADPGEVLVVRTPAVPLSSPLLKYWEARGASILKRADVLGMVTRDRHTIAVAGTHGKTTVTTMVAHLITVGKVKCNAFLGGIAGNYGTNILLNDDAQVNVVEADEYDRSFLKLSPNGVIITSMDPDHLDIYGTSEAMFDAYVEFAARCDGPLLVHESIAGYFKGHVEVDTYSLDSRKEPCVEELRVVNGAYEFDLHAEGVVLKGLRLGMPGRHNVENAIPACVVALRLGVPPELLREGLATFKGVARRFQVRIKGPDVVYIDDYAHHPKELDACISSVREMYPERHVTGIFQPHLFSRTRDHVQEFSNSLAALDRLILLDIYPAREEPIAGVDSSWLLSHVDMLHKSTCERGALLNELSCLELDVVLTLGAGDIDQLVAPIERALNDRYPQ